jgi:hypothetical protein
MMETSVEPLTFYRWSISLTFEKLMYWFDPNQGTPPTQRPCYRNNAAGKNLANWRLPMPRYFFDVTDGHRLFDASGFVCEDDTDAIIRAAVLAIGVSLDKPEDDPERRIAIINDAGREIGNVPVYSKPSYENPTK